MNNLTVKLQKLENLNSHHEIFRSICGRVTIVFDDESHLLFPNDDSYLRSYFESAHSSSPGVVVVTVLSKHFAHDELTDSRLVQTFLANFESKP